ncbi:hypothetical protein RRG08_046101 [Elysia crispata]|uniref:Uncharacterized protein n=1 Tax=Elysia crispata TaxID=231223 RepID=A0AAE0Y5V6_9GAST|nr:hypothetical protein RRG08_046101 [Elysia crispata]
MYTVVIQCFYRTLIIVGTTDTELGQTTYNPDQITLTLFRKMHQSPLCHCTLPQSVLYVTAILCACVIAASGNDELDKLMKLLINGLTGTTATNADDYQPSVNLIG